MANRKRGTFTLPEELRTNERLSTKKELAQRKSLPPCPPVPNKIRRSILLANAAFDKPRPVCFNNSVQLSPLYDSSLETSYFEQIYTKHHLIGEGSFGKVYRARSQVDNQLYAIKRLKPMISLKDRYAEVCNNEKVGVHPNCVRFFMAWEEACEVYMLLEFCDMSLSDFSDLNNDIPEELLWNVLYDICQALTYLHSKNLLHLDVKPGNIMMKNGYYKLTDFGILVDLKLAPTVCKSTLSDGDSKYLALEILEGIYTPSCDIFGLGISLLELAADLELPSYGPLWQQLRHEILPQGFYDRVSLGFKVIIERMLHPDHEIRPPAGKILKFTNIKAIEKRDKREPRVDYAAEFITPKDDVEDLPLRPIPVMVNNNNNIIGTPPCAPDYHHIEGPDFINYSIAGLEEPLNSGIGRKALFDNSKNSDSNSNELNITKSQCSSPGSFETDSSLAMNLSEYIATHQMEVDSEDNNENNENQERKDGNTSDDDTIITSTPVLRSKLFRKMPKVKLSFDD